MFDKHAHLLEKSTSCSTYTLNAPVHKTKHIYEIEAYLSWLIQLGINAHGYTDKTKRCRKYTQQNSRD